MRIGSLFSGYGGLDMGVQAVLGGTVAWHAEIDKHAAAILNHHWPDVLNLGDVTAVDWSQAEPVDVLTGGFPCQDVSTAGRRAGLTTGTRSGLWSQMARAVDEFRPGLVVIENVRGLLSATAHRTVSSVGCGVCDVETAGPDALRALGAVLGDLADLGYDARWCGVSASDVGAPHGRFRVFIVAWGAAGGSARLGLSQQPSAPVGRADSAPATDTAQTERRTTQPDSVAAAVGRAAEPRERASQDWGQYGPAIQRWERLLGRPAPAPTEPGSNGRPRLSHVFVEWMMRLPEGRVTGAPISRNNQLKALGNGVVPQQAMLALRWLLWGEWGGVEPAHVALPTPAVNDMGAGKTAEAWDEWTDRMKSDELLLPGVAKMLGGDAA